MLKYEDLSKIFFILIGLTIVILTTVLFAGIINVIKGFLVQCVRWIRKKCQRCQQRRDEEKVIVNDALFLKG